MENKEATTRIGGGCIVVVLQLITETGLGLLVAVGISVQDVKACKKEKLKITSCNQP